MKHTYMSSNFTKKATSLNISFNCNCPFRSSFLLSPSLIFAQNSRGNPCYTGREQAYLILFAILSNKCELSLV